MGIPGILLHEAGHWCALEYYGAKAKIHFAYTSVTQQSNERIKLDELNRIKATNNKFDQQAYELLIKQVKTQDFIVLVAGPLVTWLLIILALILFRTKNKRERNDLTTFQWALTCITLFSLRGVYDILKGAYSLLKYDYINGDEFKLGRLIGINEWAIPLFSLALSILVLTYVVYQLIPASRRATFVASATISELSLLLFWIILIGPRLMP